MGVKNKTSLVNLKLKPELHFEFKVAAGLRGSTMSNLLHQFIAQVVFEEKRRHTEEEWAAAVRKLQLEAEEEHERAIKKYGTHKVEFNNKATGK